MHRLQNVRHLERDRLQRRTRNVPRLGVAPQPNQHARRVRIPVRSAQPHKRRHKHHAARIRHALRQRLYISRRTNQL